MAPKHYAANPNLLSQPQPQPQPIQIFFWDNLPDLTSFTHIAQHYLLTRDEHFPGVYRRTVRGYRTTEVQTREGYWVITLVWTGNQFDRVFGWTFDIAQTKRKLEMIQYLTGYMLVEIQNQSQNQAERRVLSFCHPLTPGLPGVHEL